MTRTPKGERTREHILETALDLFREGGFEETTMRAIADAAGLSVGSTYYYFPSKDHLVQAFYMRLVTESETAVEALLEQERGLEARIAGVLHAKLDVVRPHHRFSAAIARVGIDPESPINPFSAESTPARERAIALWESVVAGAKEKIHKDLREDLPEMLWLCSEGLMLYWVYDHSEDHHRTRDLIDDASQLLSQLLKMAGRPMLGSVRKLVVSMMRSAAPWRFVPTP
jgi:AcrR family transcriptional regulator